MKRLQRKVRNSEVATKTPSPSDREGISRTFTFDRRAFSECHNRMKRIVPTLGRNQNKDSTLTIMEHYQEKDEGVKESSDDDKVLEENQGAIMALEMSDVSVPGESSELSEDATDYGPRVKFVSQSSSNGLLLDRETRSNAELEANEMRMFSSALTLPRNAGHNKAASISPIAENSQLSSATLPASFAPSKPRSRRQIWMKPLSSFVAFMSQIGDNVHITSYPQH